MTGTTMAGLAAASCACWLALRYGRGGFWRSDQRLPQTAVHDAEWPAVTAVIPARNEAPSVGLAVTSLLAQDYRGSLEIIVVDDGSSDGTAQAARGAADGSDRVRVLTSEPLPPRWTGKLWALEQGLREATRRRPRVPYVLFTDADIVHHPTSVSRLVAKAEAGRYQLVSLMALLRCEAVWERLLIPAFVFFFQKLYPFPWVNDPQRAEAAAAGGCALVRLDALATVGGLAPSGDRLIDDCALAALLKPVGPIWLGLTRDVRSLRAYHRLADVWSMVARTAYTWLECSPARLAITVFAMALIYGVPPLATISGTAALDPGTGVTGAAAWALMVATMRPTLSLLGLPAWRGALLPVAALLFTVVTLDSARRHWQGRGGMWKGRPSVQTSGRGK